MDIELWELLPISIAKVAAIAPAFITRECLPTLLIGIAGLMIGGVLREITYSDWLRRMFPLFLGSGQVTIIAIIACGIYLGSKGEYLTTIVLVAFFFMGKIEAIITSILLAPFIFFINKKYLKIFGIPSTHVERVFVLLCNNRAEKFGIELDWSLYGKDNS